MLTMKSQPTLKIALRRIGNLLSVAGIFFVSFRLYEYSDEIDFSRLSLTGWTTILFLVLIYGLANSLLALAWRDILLQLGVQIPRSLAYNIYGITQIAKYIPGNVFHLAGRQSMGISAGIASMPLLKSSIWEIGIISVAGFFFCFLILPAFLPLASQTTADMLFITSCIPAGLCLYHFAPPLARSYIFYLLFLMTTGIIFIAIINTVSNFSGPWSFLCGAYVIAWLAGLITPGAPAGIGVREIVLLFLLKGQVAEADLLLAVLLGRTVTVGGDILFFLSSLAISRQK